MKSRQKKYGAKQAEQLGGFKKNFSLQSMIRQHTWEIE
jgi:hypothetical protein